jgi:hypothetical protein
MQSCFSPIACNDFATHLSVCVSNLSRKYVFQSSSSDWSFASMVSFFRRSFKRSSAFDSGRTHHIMSIQSLSLIVAGEVSCFCSACLAFINSLARLSILDFDCNSTFLHPKQAALFGLSIRHLHYQSLFQWYSIMPL